MNFDYKKFPVTAGTIGIIIVVYLYTTVKFGLDMNASQGIEAGGFNPILVLEYNEYYRLITANLIHFGIMHIFCNAYSLYNLGTVMEMLLGKTRYAVILFMSMLATTVIPCFLYLINGMGANTILGGISGAIFGLMGALLALALCFKDVYMYLFKQVLPSIGLMLLISFAVPSISLVGHVSGLIGGFIAMLIIIKWFPLRQWKHTFYHYQDNDNLVN